MFQNYIEQLTSSSSWIFFPNVFSIEALGLFQCKVNIFFQVLQYFSRFLPQNPLFFQVFQVWTCFSRFSRCGGNPADLLRTGPVPLRLGAVSTSPPRREAVSVTLAVLSEELGFCRVSSWDFHSSCATFNKQLAASHGRSTTRRFGMA